MRLWINHFIVVGVLLLVFIIALIYRGADAVNGVLWGKDQFFCDFSITDCSINTQSINVKLGMYDINNTYSSNTSLAVDHYFISLATINREDLARNLKSSSDKNRWPLVTVEPWARDSSSTETLLEDILDRKYDEDILSVCSEFKEFDKPLFIRFGHEMERVTGRYPWAVSDSEKYIAAYRYFVQKCKESFTQGYYVWSPAGDKGLESYFPGNDVVDYVWLSIYGLDQFDKDTYGYFRSFSENLGEKYERVKTYDKPIMIAELGVVGVPDFQREWLKAGLENMDIFPLMKIVVYFNAKDNEGAWGEKYGIPDWRIRNDVFDSQ